MGRRRKKARVGSLEAEMPNGDKHTVRIRMSDASDPSDEPEVVDMDETESENATDTEPEEESVEVEELEEDEEEGEEEEIVEASLTKRQLAMRKRGSMVESSDDESAPLAPVRVTLSEEQMLRKSEAARKRKNQVAKQEEEEKRAVIEKLLKKTTSRLDKGDKAKRIKQVRKRLSKRHSAIELITDKIRYVARASPTDSLEIVLGVPAGIDVLPVEKPKVINRPPTLGVSRSASEADIKARWQVVARLWHPDRSSHPNAQERFMNARKAYEQLNSKVQVDGNALEITGSSSSLLESGIWLVFSRTARCGSRECRAATSFWRDLRVHTDGMLQHSLLLVDQEFDWARNVLSGTGSRAIYAPHIVVFRHGRRTLLYRVYPDTKLGYVVSRISAAAFPPPKKPQLDSQTLLGLFWEKKVAFLVTQTAPEMSLLHAYLQDSVEGRIDIAPIRLHQAKSMGLVDQAKALPVLVTSSADSKSFNELDNIGSLHPTLVLSTLIDVLRQNERFDANTLLHGGNFYDLCYSDPKTLCVVALTKPEEILTSQLDSRVLQASNIQLGWIESARNPEFVKLVGSEVSWVVLQAPSQRYAVRGDLTPHQLNEWLLEIVDGKVSSWQNALNRGGLPFLQDPKSRVSFGLLSDLSIVMSVLLGVAVIVLFQVVFH